MLASTARAAGKEHERSTNPVKDWGKQSRTCASLEAAPGDLLGALGALRNPVEPQGSLLEPVLLSLTLSLSLSLSGSLFIVTFLCLCLYLSLYL